MKILGLDLSTKSGFAVIQDGKLAARGLVQVAKVVDFRLDDLNMVRRAQNVVDALCSLILMHAPDRIYIEQTNAGRFRGSQKQLEFIHCLLLNQMMGLEKSLYYVDTSRWRSTLKVSLSKDERKHNKLVKNRLARGKVTPKHVCVKWANQTFGLSLKLKDNDIADAIAIAVFGYRDSCSKYQTESLDSALLGKK